MVTGRKAFSGDSPLLTLTAILRDEPQPVEELAPGTPPELVALIHRAMRKEPGQRFQSMQEMHADLLALKQRSDSGVLTVQTIPAAEPKARSGRGAFHLCAGDGGAGRRAIRRSLVVDGPSHCQAGGGIKCSSGESKRASQAVRTVAG